MKNILYIIIFLFSIGALSCECNPITITEKYIESEFVANVTITKIYPNKINEKGYKADIKINDLFKGDRLKSIYVYGRSDNGIGGSCDIYIPINTKLIAYARVNKEGHYGVGMCSGLMYIDYSNLYRKKTLKSTRELERQKREIDILNTFKEKEIVFTSKIIYREKATLYKNLEQFKGLNLDKNYAIYEVSFSSDLKLKTIKEISGFGNSIDKKLIEILEKTEWSSYDNGIKDKVPDNSKLLIGIYFYGKEKGNPSFLSQLYL